MEHITFDLETLGNKANGAPIVQIGAVKFEKNGDILDNFVRYVDIKRLSKYDFEVDYETLHWWFTQPHQTIQEVMVNNKRIDLSHALYDFQNWVGKLSQYTYWSHSTFDPPILENNFMKTKGYYPFPYKNFKDIRTLMYFSDTMDDVLRGGMHHSALDDAKFQAKYISKALRKHG